MNAMPQLNDAESKFSSSGGQDLAPSLSETAPEPEAPAADAEGVSASHQNWILASAGMTKGDEAGEKPGKKRDGRFVPLKVLQEERAEKKQLREELRAFREWQTQLTQRLQQFPQAQAPAAPDPTYIASRIRDFAPWLGARD